MGFEYKLAVKCDGCSAVLSADKSVGSFGGGVGGKPADVPAVLDPQTSEVIQPAKPGELADVAAWRCNGDAGEQILCPGCLLGEIEREPCVLWSAVRIQV